MRKTKIVCTLGPATDDKEVLRELVKAGLDVARLNFSHGSHAEHGQRIDLVREVEAELGKTIGIMLDTKGPEIRTGDLKEGKVCLSKGEEIIITTEEISGDKDKISITYQDITKDVKAGSKILIDDGLIELEVLEVGEKELKCIVLNDGVLGAHKGVNLPGISVKLPALTEKDCQDISFGLSKGINFIAASFVRKAADVEEIRDFLAAQGAEGVYIIAKIENQEGVDNIDEIIAVADGIMVARGDLGVEILPEKVPLIQKNIIKKCNQAGKPVITATQMLESMIRNPRPTRAEASDVANAICDGTDATMLSGESAIGDYPVEAVRTMAKIAEEVETSQLYFERVLNRMQETSDSITAAISFASCKIAQDLKARFIVTSTSSGLTARMVSKHRPITPIAAVTPHQSVEHFLTLVWGVFPILVADSDNTDEMIHNALHAALDYGLVEKGDLVTITAGVPVGKSGTTNLIEVLRVGNNQDFEHYI